LTGPDGVEDEELDEGIEYRFGKEREIDVLVHLLGLNINIEGNWILSSGVRCVSREDSIECIKHSREPPDLDS
jgi:hypothetical protein